MKFELKTENQNYPKSFGYFFVAIFCLALIIMVGDVTLKIGIISRNYEIENYCRLLFVDKSKSNFKKLSRLSDLKSKQKIWEFCRELVK